MFPQDRHMHAASQSLTLATETTVKYVGNLDQLKSTEIQRCAVCPVVAAKGPKRRWDLEKVKVTLRGRGRGAARTGPGDSDVAGCLKNSRHEQPDCLQLCSFPWLFGCCVLSSRQEARQSSFFPFALVATDLTKPVCHSQKPEQDMRHGLSGITAESTITPQDAFYNHLFLLA